jgi:histidinol-phosphatase (PHP family)
MIANYHTHTPRCNHAQGEERQYIEAAIQNGLKILGFADHSPQIYPGDYVSGIRMLPEELDGYIHTLEGLRAEYADRIEIRCGLEVEYFPDLFGDLLSFLRQHPGVEYLILGQHCAGNEYDVERVNRWYTGAWEQGDEYKLARYVEQVAEGMQTRKFLYLAHPDVCLYSGDPDVYRKHMRALCREAKRCNLPLEINAQGLRRKDINNSYPVPAFWQIAAEEGCTAVFGCDAHQPEYTGDAEYVAIMEKVAKDCGIRVLDTLEIKKENWK